VDSLFGPPDPPPASRESAGAPLAARLRPASLADVVGQEHLLAPGSALRTAIEAGRPHSMILHGPPGSGKTTLARLVAGAARAAFEEASAVEAGRAEVRAVLERARHRRQASGTPTVFFLDEIHRFNKAQQDALLPAVEEGLIALIGATTENPRFEVNAALLSRCALYELRPLEPPGVRVLLERALRELGAAADPDALDFLATRAGGDARSALGALELAAATVGAGAPVTLAAAEDALGRRAIRYDKGGDQHYDLISAWIKATRGSDPDASLYYLAVMLEGGEDPRFVVRRMVILASEDVGNADPRALQVAVAAAAAVEHVGLPEAAHALAQCATYLACAPKSNASYTALKAARAHVREHGAQAPPGYLRDPAAGPEPYAYPHDEAGGLAAQELLPPRVAGTRFYLPEGREPGMAERLERIRAGRAAARRP
jgi:putative ATPase